MCVVSFLDSDMSHMCRSLPPPGTAFPDSLLHLLLPLAQTDGLVYLSLQNGKYVFYVTPTFNYGRNHGARMTLATGIQVGWWVGGGLGGPCCHQLAATVGGEETFQAAAAAGRQAGTS